MGPQQYLKGACEHCGNGIEFPFSASGETITCPHCTGQTVLIAGETERPADKVNIADILNSFAGTVSKTRASFLYQVGLIMVTLVMVLLPILYVGLVALAGWGVYLFATHCTGLLHYHHSARLYLIQLILYAGPLFIGCILVFFLIKPLFARPPRRAQPLALNPAAEPAVFAFIAKICDAVGAPMPTRIDLDCNLNAAAGFRRGIRSLFGNDLVLTLGLPLVAGLTVQQLAGVVAHEFGHFTQGFGMRLSYIIRAVNAWFARVVYERDAWDVTLEQTAAEAEDWRWIIVIGCAQGGVWISRQILFLLMLFGHVVCSFLLRQMEYDADTYEIRLAGSEAFEETCKRMHVLGNLLKPTYKGMEMKLKSSRELPDNFPALLMQHDASLAHDKRTQLQDTMGMHASSIFHSHPSTGDRIRCARQMQEPGIFNNQSPASDLFRNFEELSKQVTQLHYTDDLGLVNAGIKLVPIRAREEAVEPTPAFNPLAQDLSDTPVTPGKLRLKK